MKILTELQQFLILPFAAPPYLTNEPKASHIDWAAAFPLAGA